MNSNELAARATAAATNAYANYSDFPAGAAVSANGEVFDGCNIDNASYGLSICAERVAMFKAVSAGHTKIDKLAVHCIKGDATKPQTMMPCGACRQVMQEFMSEKAVVIVEGAGQFTLSELLPRALSL